MRWLLLFLLTISGSLTASENEPPVEFVIISPSYNNAKWCEKSLKSVVSQTYPHWSLIYIDDCSTDSTASLVDNFIKKHALSEKCQLINNSQRLGAMENCYHAIHTLPGNKVIVNLDGDDRLAHKNVLKKLAKVYAKKKVWMTYGSYKTEPKEFGNMCVCHKYPKQVIKSQGFRMHPQWMASHLKTYYAKLFQKIKKEDLLHHGHFFSVASDLAFMFPMLEMASKGHIRFIKEKLYIYNHNNPINDDKIRLEEQRTVDRYIRQKPRYKPLKKLL